MTPKEINVSEYQSEKLFLQYVRIDTQSDPHSDSVPSTLKQRNLGELLARQLIGMGLTAVELDGYGYVYATLPSNLPEEQEVPVVCFCSHMDTSPDCSGKDVRPLVHRNYQGEPIVLPDDPKEVLKPEKHPDLLSQIGNDIITASGTTLLGADNKAGLAAIMDAVALLLKHPEIPHGDIRILFTPDEEIGRGVDHVNLEKLAADFAYTVDGETRGSIEDETFSADAMIINIQGVSAHPGFAKGNMQSAIKIASELISRLPKDRLAPEATEGKEGFVHPVSLSGSAEEARIEFIVRDFDTAMLKRHEEEVEELLQSILLRYPGAGFEIAVQEQYRNMKEVIDQHPLCLEIGIEAIRLAGMKPIRRSIRGGTDGSRLSLMGLPCPNIFAGEHAFHGKQEWVSVQDMQKATQTLLNIAQLVTRYSKKDLA